MIIKYFKILHKKIEKYDKKAQNPFLSKEIIYNPNKSIYNQTYIWIEKQKPWYIQGFYNKQIKHFCFICCIIIYVLFIKGISEWREELQKASCNHF